ncbi:hypothetical protein PputGB1_1623 [Pseudomonas putida GB-1]|uniref:Uncharacterized protein n=2 Tax=Pseudomonas TaxID=286 RepID=B0KGA7_PSEPG|nr:hypothetical protein PputGB1_1623 [Pseudomonas putida GB-1]
MKVFSFRADSLQDDFELMQAKGTRDISRLTIYPDSSFPDVEVELVTEMSEQELREAVAGLDEAHVIADTLRPCELKMNPFQRGEDPDPLPPSPEF